MNLLILIILAAGAVALAAWWQENARAEVDDSYRQDAPGSFAHLSQGVTHYRWHGPVRGPVLVAIHGLTTPSMVWAELAHGFAAFGFRVLTYDLYGRGYSDAYDGPQDAAHFVKQLEELLADQGVEQDVSLVGYSMGGSIATAFAAANLHRVDRLFLVASAGVETVESGFSQFCRRTGPIGSLVFATFAGPRMKRALQSDECALDVPGLKEHQLAQLDRRGFLPSVLASRRGLLSDRQEVEHRAIAQRNIPVFAVWGGADAVIPVSSVGTLAKWNRSAFQDVIDGAGHALPNTHSDELMAALRSQIHH